MNHNTAKPIHFSNIVEDEDYYIKMMNLGEATVHTVYYSKELSGWMVRIVDGGFNGDKRYRKGDTCLIHDGIGKWYEPEAM
jgi:hypothetical protein